MNSNPPVKIKKTARDKPLSIVACESSPGIGAICVQNIMMTSSENKIIPTAASLVV
jgi:hypothetical protein